MSGDTFYDPWDEIDGYLRKTSESYNISLGDRIFTVNPDFLTETTEQRNIYKTYSEKLTEILYDVLLEFSGSGIKIINSNSLNILVGVSKSVSIKVVFEESNKKTIVEYDPETHEISGLVWISLGDRELTEITKEEINIIQRSLLVWIYDNL